MFLFLRLSVRNAFEWNEQELYEELVLSPQLFLSVTIFYRFIIEHAQLLPCAELHCLNYENATEL